MEKRPPLKRTEESVSSVTLPLIRGYYTLIQLVKKKGSYMKCWFCQKEIDEETLWAPYGVPSSCFMTTYKGEAKRVCKVCWDEFDLSGTTLVESFLERKRGSK